MKTQTDELFVFSENVDAVEVFMTMTTQWVVAGMGTIIGLNYQSLEFVMKTLSIKNKKDCLFRIKVMEKRALEIFKKREKPNGPTTQI